MKLSYETIDALNTAYTNLPVKGIVVLTLAENMIKLNPHLKAALAVKDKLIKENTGGKEQISSGHKNWQKFAMDYNLVLKKEIEVVGLEKLKKTDINFDKEVDGNLQALLKVLLENGLLE